ncbi:MAG: hypothetical protein WCC87_06620 [Candidatus Korobacteraceae bacterium]
MRLQLDIDENAASLLSWLKEKTGAKTQKELFNNAITLLFWALKQRLQGRTIAAVDEKRESFRELQMPALEFASTLPITESDRRWIEPEKRNEQVAAFAATGRI